MFMTDPQPTMMRSISNYLMKSKKTTAKLVKKKKNSP